MLDGSRLWWTKSFRWMWLNPLAQWCKIFIIVSNRRSDGIFRWTSVKEEPKYSETTIVRSGMEIWKWLLATPLLDLHKFPSYHAFLAAHPDTEWDSDAPSSSNIETFPESKWSSVSVAAHSASRRRCAMTWRWRWGPTAAKRILTPMGTSWVVLSKIFSKLQLAIQSQQCGAFTESKTCTTKTFSRRHIKF